MNLKDLKKFNDNKPFMRLCAKFDAYVEVSPPWHNYCLVGNKKLDDIEIDFENHKMDDSSYVATHALGYYIITHTIKHYIFDGNRISFSQDLITYLKDDEVGLLRSIGKIKTIRETTEEDVLMCELQ